MPTFHRPQLQAVRWTKPNAAQKLLAPVVVAICPTLLPNAVNAVPPTNRAYPPFEALINKLGVLVKVGDEIAKVCSFGISPL